MSCQSSLRLSSCLERSPGSLGPKSCFAEQESSLGQIEKSLTFSDMSLELVLNRWVSVHLSTLPKSMLVFLKRHSAFHLLR